MKKQIFFLTAYIIGVLTLTAQEGEVINHIFDGNQQAESKKFNEAEMAYRRALSKAPEKPEALYNLGNTHFEEQDFDEAKQRYFQTQKFTENKFSKQQAFHNLGNVFMKQKDYAKAVEAYKNALRNNPEDEETRYNYALAKELLKKEQDQQNQDQQDQQNEDEQENKDQNQDQNKEGDKDKDSGQDNDEEQGDEGDKDEDKKEEGDQKKENQPQQGDQEKEQPAQPRKTELSPEQVKSLLEAMSNQEKKVQDKVNAEKVQGIPVRGQKDW
ncbi:MAG: tetratricopeptide repeat protein [Flavobacteriaceae bacterium]|jgi:tetratricopeptide (TPR) repeat protein|nr:tetratricopeptide repeat protein [Flavobacteriaceae bacterium]